MHSETTEYLISEDDTLQSVWGQCRKLGSGDEGPSPWTSIAADSLGTVETIIAWYPPDDLEDGVYELRAATQCIKGGQGYSEGAIGTIERHGPQVLGTPEPADGELSFGEDISITFNELTDCRRVHPDSGTVSLMYVDGDSAAIPFTLVCDKRTIVITPTASPCRNGGPPDRGDGHRHSRQSGQPDVESGDVGVRLPQEPLHVE